MNNAWANIRLLVVTAGRNVVSHRMKSLIVGFILMFGAALLVTGSALLDSVEQSMEQTVTQSLTGHLQVYSSDAEDELALFGNVMFGGDDVGEIEHIGTVRRSIESLDNVEAVIPMGMTQARVVMGNRIDQVVAKLRQAVAGHDDQSIGQLADQLRAMVRDLKAQNAARAKIAADSERFEQRSAILDRVLGEAFWANDLPDHPGDALQFLDTRVAPLASDAGLVFMRLLGTDPQRFAHNFERFEIVDGQMIPPGHHGLLVNQRSYDKWLKNPVARHLDKLAKKLHDDQRVIADDQRLQGDIERLQKRYRQLTFGLPPHKVARLERRVATYLDRPAPTHSADSKELWAEFLALTDQNFDERYDFFYDQLAPLMRMHDFDIGDTVTLQAFTDRGFPRSTNLKVYGTFTFEGMEDSELAGSVSMVDLPTFRTLYGAMSLDDRRELERIRKQVGVEDIRRDEAESALFGETKTPLVAEAPTDNDASDPASAGGPAKPAADRRGSGTFDPADIDRGLARNAAVVLKDPTRLADTRAAIQALSTRKSLGLTVVDWREAAGIVGQFVIVIRLALLVAIGIIFLVALVIINNSMVMATVERTPEIGTMRAIGARRWYVMALFLCETLILGLVGGLLGCILGGAAVEIAGSTGVPATTDFLRFLFAGDYLYPALRVSNLVGAFVAIVVVSVISTLYPATLAARIQPIVAMRK